MIRTRTSALLLVFASHTTADAADLKEDLLAAARKGDSAAIKALLAKGADVNAKGPYGVTALSCAADKGHVETVKLLLQHKADVNARDGFYMATPLTWAVYRGHADVVQTLLEAGATGAEGSVAAAAMRGHAGVVRVLIGKGKVKPEGLNAALAATPTKHTAVIELLTKAGAKPPEKKETASASAKEPRPAPARIEDAPAEVKVPLNWPSFRGPGASGIADGQAPPTTWDVPGGSNVRWKTPIPGLGHSCPVVWGGRVFVTTAVSGDPRAGFRPGQYGDVDSVEDGSIHTWHVCCLDKRTGKVLWDRIAHKGVPKVKRHLKGSQANPTPAADARHLVACFGSEGLYCYDHDGNRMWKRDLGTLDAGWFYDADYQWGFGSSPILYRDLVIVQCDVGKGSFVAAYRLADGTEAWRTPREEVPSWGTPTIIDGPDGPELVTNATKFARAYDPLTGKELWRLARHSEITVPTPIAGQGLIFVTSGYRPIQPIYAIRPGARGDISIADGKTSNDSVVWSKQQGGPYMTTPIVYKDYLYACLNSGMLTCYKAKTGNQVYRERLGGGGGYTASPVAADGRLYLTSEEDGVRVVKAGPKFELLAANPLGEVCLATPAIADGMIFFRTQHHVVALGRAQAKASGE